MLYNTVNTNTQPWLHTCVRERTEYATYVALSDVHAGLEEEVVTESYYDRVIISLSKALEAKEQLEFDAMFA